MIFDNRPADAITAADVQSLLDDQLPEGQHLDYKLALPDRRDRQAAEEFRLDVAAFANAEGGYILHGVAEADRLPASIPGLSALDVEGEVRRLGAILDADLEPRVAGVTIAAVALPGADPVVVIHVPRSWQRPHWVRAHQLRGWIRFVARRDADKITLDYREARSLFLGTADLADRLRQFRAERLARILAGETPVALPPGPKIVLHVAPFAAFEGTTQLAVQVFDEIGHYNAIAPLGGSQYSRRPNFDGYLTHEGARGGPQECYLQIFRNGCLETVNAQMLAANGDQRLISSPYLEDKLQAAVARYLSLLQEQGVAPPCAVLLSLLGVRGYTLTPPGRLIPDRHFPLERDTYLCEPVLAEGVDADVPTLLRPISDALWQAVGWRESPHYDRTNGTWTPRQ